MQSYLRQDLSGTVLEGGVVLIELIGEGGMGQVYKGKQTSVGRAVCVKFIHADLLSCPGWYQRFEREARVLARINHRGIVSVYFVGLLNHLVPYIVMEYIEGRTLRHMILEENLDWRSVCEIMAQVCEAMDHVHHERIIHRDLKPENIVITIDDQGQCLAKIIDFGVSRVEGSATVTAIDTILGSVLYMAPECFEKAQTRPTADIYAIGCILYECLTKSPLFESSSLAGIAYKHARESVPTLRRISSANEAEVAALQQIIDTSCAKKPSQRFSSCGRMATLLRDVACGRTADTSGIEMPNTFRRALFAVMVLMCLFVVMAGIRSSRLPQDKDTNDAGATKLSRSEDHLNRLLVTYKTTPDSAPEKPVLGKNLLDRLRQVCEEAIDARFDERPAVLIEHILPQVNYSNDDYEKTELFLNIHCYYDRSAVNEHDSCTLKIKRRQSELFYRRAEQMASISKDPRVTMDVSIQKCNILLLAARIREFRVLFDKTWCSAMDNGLERDYRWVNLLNVLSGASYSTCDDAFDVCETIAVLGSRCTNEKIAAEACQHAYVLIRSADLKKADPARCAKLLAQLNRARSTIK